jgi:hypothetical protein
MHPAVNLCLPLAIKWPPSHPVRLPARPPARLLQVVHSRTFGAPGRQGSVGVRMLVPLVDMLNHAGDYITSPPGASSAGALPAVQAYDNVRCGGQPALLCVGINLGMRPPCGVCVGMDQPTYRAAGGLSNLNRLDYCIPGHPCLQVGSEGPHQRQ